MSDPRRARLLRREAETLYYQLVRSNARKELVEQAKRRYLRRKAAVRSGETLPVKVVLSASVIAKR